MLNPKLKALIDKAAQDCQDAQANCFFAANAKKKIVEILTRLMEQVEKEFSAVPAPQPIIENELEPNED